MKFFALLLLFLLSAAFAIPTQPVGPKWSRPTNDTKPRILDRKAIEATTDRFLFNTSMEEFQKARKAGIPITQDWSSDGCSDAPRHPFGFHFLEGCQRHDFGYRNYKAQSRFTKRSREIIDNYFFKDLFNYCQQLKWYKQPGCIGLAFTYWAGTRLFGH